MDYRDVLATVVGASVAGIVAFAIRLIFPINAAVLALIYAATYSLLWSIVGDHSRQVFHRYLPASTRLDGHWRLVTGSLALVAAGAAGLIIAVALSRPSSVVSATTPSTRSSLITQTVRLQPRVVVSKKTIVLPVETRLVTTAVTPEPGRTATIISHTVVIERPAVTITVATTRPVQTETITQTTPTVTEPATTQATVDTTAATGTLPLGVTAEPPPTTSPETAAAP
jgi:hypothetical protein